MLAVLGIILLWSDNHNLQENMPYGVLKIYMWKH